MSDGILMVAIGERYVQLEMFFCVGDPGTTELITIWFPSISPCRLHDEAAGGANVEEVAGLPDLTIQWLNRIRNGVAQASLLPRFAVASRKKEAPEMIHLALDAWDFDLLPEGANWASNHVSNALGIGGYIAVAA